MELHELIADLTDEHAALDRVLASLPAEAWELPTHAPGWAVRDQVAHLASTDESATLAIADPDSFVARREERRSAGERDGEPAFLATGRALKPADLLAWWRTASGALIAAARAADSERRLPWFGPPMSAASFLTARLMETWSHGLDVVDVTASARPDSDRLRHVALIGVLARAYSYRNHGLEPPAASVRVELTLPSGAAWSHGAATASDRVSGAATDFCRVVTRRRHVDDTDLLVEGDDARCWLLIAQAFAGPPGDGRWPGQFRKVSQGG